MAKLSMQQIKELVHANCGGLRDKSDSDIRHFWNSLKEKTRNHYIEKAKVKNKDDGKPKTKPNS